MRSLSTRLDKLTYKKRLLPELVIYEKGEDVESKPLRNASVFVYLPENHRSKHRVPSPH